LFRLGASDIDLCRSSLVTIVCETAFDLFKTGVDAALLLVLGEAKF